MKKTYTKPEIVFESFSFSTSIAGDCERIVGNPSRGTCGVPDATGQFPVFIDSNTGCVITGSDDQYDGFCYHVPVDSKNLFNS